MGRKMNIQKNEKLYNYKFKLIYELYLQKIKRKDHSKEELDKILTWLTGYEEFEAINEEVSLEQFFKDAPNINENAKLIKGVICGYRVEDIEDELTQKIRWMDKIVDELYKGKKTDKIMR